MDNIQRAPSECLEKPPEIRISQPEGLKAISPGWSEPRERTPGVHSSCEQSIRPGAAASPPTVGGGCGQKAGTDRAALFGEATPGVRSFHSLDPGLVCFHPFGMGNPQRRPEEREVRKAVPFKK